MNGLAQLTHQLQFTTRTATHLVRLGNSSACQQDRTSCRNYHPSDPAHQRQQLFKPADHPTERPQDAPRADGPEKVTPSRQFTVSQSEIEHFNKLGSTWWNEYGAFGLLHKMNPVRVQFLKDRLRDDELIPHPPQQSHHHTSHGATPPSAGEQSTHSFTFLDGKHVLDVGCGGGIFSEVLARLGARVLGIDAAEDSIQAAEQHAQLDPHFRLNSPSPSEPPLGYRHCSVEDLLESDNLVHYGRYDLVCAMEVVEHVEDLPRFLSALAELTKPGGQIILSTISRTPLSRFLTITLAESNLPLIGLVPPGTHTYEKFVKPDELTAFFRGRLGWAKSFERVDLEMRGCMFDPLAAKWRLFPRDAPWGGWCNYFYGVRKPL